MKQNNNMMTFGEHLEVLRRMLFRMIVIVFAIAFVVFCFKDFTFNILLAPSEYNFCTYKWIETIVNLFNVNFHFNHFYVDLITTDLSSQFLTHITTSIYLGLLGASPYLFYELFSYLSPALYENERKHSTRIVLIIYLLFISGVLMSYFVLFPIAFRFLGTYSVAERVHSTITLDSYIETFVSLTLLIGVVFQLPVVSFILAKFGIISYEILSKFRKHALIVIMMVSAIITPPDIMTLLLVSVPLYLLYECSIHIVKHVTK